MIDFKNLKNKAFIVGGAIRDEILGLPVSDVDYVVTATEEEFRSTFPDVSPVGNDFPVFIIDGSEVALSRQEVSSGKGYGDFKVTAVGVSIEDDLARRDFSINSFCKSVATGELIDPFNGIHDLKAGIIRTINKKAFEEDPVRILRAARFAARFNFVIEEETKELLKANAFRLQFVTKERIVKELEKLHKSSSKPSIFFNVLAEIDALKFIFPALDKLRFVTAGPVEFHKGHNAFEHTLEALDRFRGSFHGFIAVLFHDLGKGETSEELLEKGHHYGHELKSADISREIVYEFPFTREVREFVPTAAKLHMKAHFLTKMRPEKLLRLSEQIPTRFQEDFISVVNADSPLTTEQDRVIRIIFKVRKINLSTEEIQQVTVAKNKEEKVRGIRLKKLRSLLNEI